MSLQTRLSALITAIGADIKALRAGSPSFPYIYSTDVASTDPGSGGIKFDNTTFASIGSIRISETDALSRNLATLLGTLDDTIGTVKYYIHMTKEADPTTFWTFYARTALTDNGTWRSGGSLIAQSGSGTFSNGDAVRVAILRVGEMSQNGGDGFSFTKSSTTTDADPGAGTLRLNNVSMPSVTQIYVDLLDAFGSDITDWLDNIGAIGGRIKLLSRTTPTAWVTFTLDSITVATGYRKLNVTLVDFSGGLTTNVGDTFMSFTPNGLNSISGSTLTSLTGMIRGNGTDIDVATDGTHYLSPTTGVVVAEQLRYHDVVSTASTATLTPTSAANQYNVTAQAASLAIAATTGSKVDGQGILFRIKDNGTIRTISWDASYRAVGITLPLATVASKTVYIGGKWNAADSVFDMIAVGQQA